MNTIHMQETCYSLTPKLNQSATGSVVVTTCRISSGMFQRLRTIVVNIVGRFSSFFIYIFLMCNAIHNLSTIKCPLLS